MSDNSDDTAEKMKQWEERLASGAPIMQVVIDTPFKAFRAEAGVLAIDTATFGVAGFDRLGTLRVLVTPSAEKALKTLFENLEKIPHGQIGGKRTQSAN
jgi:hypothetical protein